MLTFTPILLDRRRLFLYEYLLSYDASLVVLVCYVLVMFGRPRVYKCPTPRLRNSKRVLFCTNTSRRRTCHFPYLVKPDPRGIPYTELS